MTASDNLRYHVGNVRFRSVVVDPPWQFNHRSGKVAPEHKRLTKYKTMTLDEIMLLPIEEIVPEDDEESSHSSKNPLMYDMKADGIAELHGRDDTCRSAPRRH